MSTSSKFGSNRYLDTFGRKPVLLPVIHVVSLAQALASCRIAAEAGCRGWFLISHRLLYQDLFEIYHKVREEFPSQWIWIGLNALDLSPHQAIERIPSGVSGIWNDDGLIREGAASQAEAADIWAAIQDRQPPTLLFGGVAFKYGPPVQDVYSVAARARHHMDVVTTSGPGTGKPADLDKIRCMRAAMGDRPLALASGVTTVNAREYVSAGVNCFLVATSITGKEDEILIREQVVELREAIEG